MNAAIDKALADSPTYKRLLAEKVQRDYAADLAAAVKPLADAIAEMNGRLGQLVEAMGAQDAPVVNIAASPALDLTPLLDVVAANGRQMASTVASLEAAVMADVAVEHDRHGRPLKAVRVKRSH